MSISVDASELQNFGDELAVIAAIEKRVTPIVSKAAADVAAEAKKIAPVDTGNLRNSIAPRSVDATTAEVVSNTNYSVFVEYGTRKMAPRPHMRPALEKVAPVFAEALGQIGAEL